MWWLLISISFLILDLPKLHTISFYGDDALAGDSQYNRKTIINGHESYNNTLIMKSKLKWNVNCILILIFRSSFTHWYSGSWLYSPFYGICDIGKYDLIKIDLIRHSKSHWKRHWLWKIFILPHCWFTSNKYFSFSFHFHFHVLDATALENYIRNMPKNWEWD